MPKAWYKYKGKLSEGDYKYLSDLVDEHDIQTVIYELSDIATNYADAEDENGNVKLVDKWDKIATILDIAIEEINTVVEKD